MKAKHLGVAGIALCGVLFAWIVNSGAASRSGYTTSHFSPTDQSMNETNGSADLALINGVIYTGDPKQPRVEALAARGETIVATGSTSDIRKRIGARIQVIDLHGGFAMPGFNDAHLHLASGGQAKLSVDLEGAKSIAEFQQRVRARVATTKPGEWITGRGWDHTLWNPPNFPTRQALDEVTGDHPAFFSHISGHVAVANSKALQLSGITAATPNPSGGKIEHGADGQPDGMFEEDSAMALVGRKIPRATHEQQLHGIELALQEAAANGLTSIQDYSSWR